MSILDVLESIRAHATSERDKGDRFERLVRSALRIDRTYRQQFEEVWLWSDWPDRGNEPDIGIDLVAKNTDGGFTAIQCKFYGEDLPLVKEDIDSFFTASGREPFTHRIIVATTDHWSINAEKSLVGQRIPVTRIGIDDLEAMTIDWTRFDVDGLDRLVETAKKSLLPHQVTASEKVRAGFGESDRGKLIMACGTGKTLTSLRIAEEHAGAGTAVLFLAPSIALVSQSLKEWTGECEVPIRPFVVCSDATAGKPVDGEQATPFDLAVPPTTSVPALVAANLGDLPADVMTVIFATYQSIQVVADVQAVTGLTFDLVICDEAHRTTGVSTPSEDDSAFVKVHDDAVIPARRRLYMTATPRIYKPAAKADAAEQDAVLASMDDPDLYGPEFHRLGFGEAVDAGLLADYRVLILSVEEDAISRSFQDLLSENGELDLPDVAKFIGCLSGLAKLPGSSGGGFTGEEPPMQRAVAFWSNIAESKRFAEQFDLVAGHYNRQRAASADPAGPQVRQLRVPTRHVDGTTNIRSRRGDIRWLKDNPDADECRVLTNAKCLTEGVDVPALDAVMFLKPRRSKIDIVQAVGRVMRKPPGKSIGYIILPIAVPAGQDAAAALDKNKDYDVVWDVLQALRSHDERFNAYINRIALLSDEPGSDPEGPIEIIDATPPADHDEKDAGEEGATDSPVQYKLFAFQDWSDAIYTKLVKKVGSRTYWEDWATDVAKIAARHELRISAILDGGADAAGAFDRFLAGLRENLNDSISRGDAISMLSQHLITRPIFDALFGSESFALNNPVSQAMQEMIDVLDRHHLATETEDLGGFYDSVRRRVEGIPPHDAAARQRIIKDLYGRFFSIAFPKVAASLGIVYTPIEVVDFILRATEGALNKHFGASLSDAGVHVLDPFTGTGTFVTRLLQLGIIRPHDLVRKYLEEIHANEILLLAYYIAAVNIEMTYLQVHEASAADAQPFPGIVLTDTFQLGEAGEGSGAFDVFPVNNERASRQKGLDIRVIVGNPPYSVGQESANDDNANLTYPALDRSITDTYAALSTSVNKNSLYDSYIRALRWASNRIVSAQHGGVVAFVTNGGYIEGNTADGIRLALAREFHHIYLYNLKGNQRTAGEQSRREGGKIFGGGSRASVAIALFIKLPGPVPESGAAIRYRAIDDYLTREEKLAILDRDSLVTQAPSNILDESMWDAIEPNGHGDWISHRSEAFAALLPAQEKGEPSIFTMRSRGLETGRDAWNYNSSSKALESNAVRMIDNFNAQVDATAAARAELTGKREGQTAAVKKLVDLDPSRFSWNHADFIRLAAGQKYRMEDAAFTIGTYRPFHRRHVNAGLKLNHRANLLPKIHPRAGVANLAIGVSTVGARNPFSAFMTRDLPDVHLWIDDTPCLPRFVFDDGSRSTPAGSPPQLFDAASGTEATLPVGATHNVTDHALGVYRALDSAIDKDDIFFYVYGVLHSADYRAAFAADLKKSLPRIPRVDDPGAFWAFSKAGRELSDLHTEYETVDPWPSLDIRYVDGFDPDAPTAYRVQKMRYAKVPAPGDPDARKIDDKTTIIYNTAITIAAIPQRAHDYRLGARSALDWVIESNQVKTDKDSGIVNDPNDWATESGEPRYILDLISRVVTVSMRTLDIIDALPRLSL